MSTDEELAPDMRDLLAAVGEVLLKWGFLEHESVNPTKPSIRLGETRRMARFSPGEDLASWR